MTPGIIKTDARLDLHDTVGDEDVLLPPAGHRFGSQALFMVDFIGNAVINHST